MFTSVSPDAPLVLIDFGNSVRLKPGKAIKKCTGTCYFMAPEIIKGRYDEKVDIWSSGVLLYLMLCGKPPFDGHSP